METEPSVMEVEEERETQSAGFLLLLKPSERETLKAEAAAAKKTMTRYIRDMLNERWTKQRAA